MPGHVHITGFFEPEELKEDVEGFVLLGAVDYPVMFLRELQFKDVGKVRSGQCFEADHCAEHASDYGCVGIAISSLTDHIPDMALITKLVVRSGC